MAAGDEQAALAEIGVRLCAEFGYALVEDVLDEPPSPDDEARTSLFGNFLGPEDERLVAAARHSLVRIATALRARNSTGAPETAVAALLDGAELMMRSELAIGNPPSAMMASLVYLVAMPMVEQEEALALSSRTSSLLEEAMS